MAVTARTEDSLAKRSRLTGVRRAFAPVFEARGQARWMLWLGAAITLAFVFVAIFAPVLAPYDCDTFRANGQRRLVVTDTIIRFPSPNGVSQREAGPEVAGILLLNALEERDRIGAGGLHSLSERHQELDGLNPHDRFFGQFR